MTATQKSELVATLKSAIETRKITTLRQALAQAEALEPGVATKSKPTPPNFVFTKLTHTDGPGMVRRIASLLPVK